MDITIDNIFTDINGYVIYEFNHLNNGKIFKIYTDKLGLISIYSRKVDSFFSLYSKYNFKLIKGENFFYCSEFDLLKYNFFKEKNYILFLNMLTEIILKTSVEENKNDEVFYLISDVLNNFKKFNYKFILIFFVLKYMKYNGYHIFFEDKISKSYNFNINELDVNILDDFILDKKYNYKLNIDEYNFLYTLNNIKSLENLNNFKYNISISRIFGILINALCLNFNINKLNTFGLFN